jgi:hypothetical protein
MFYFRILPFQDVSLSQAGQFALRLVGWAGTDSTLNRCASGSSSSIPMASSPVSTLERLSGPTLDLPGRIMTSKLELLE